MFFEISFLKGEKFMKRMNKLFILLTTLFAGSSFMSANNANQAVVAEAAVYATLSKDWKSIVKELHSVSTLLITNKQANQYPANMLVTIDSYDVDTDANYKAIDASVYGVVEEGVQKVECVIYANVDTINVEFGTSFFSSLGSIEKIIFDCPLSFSNSRDKSMQYLFKDNTRLTTIEGINNLQTFLVTGMSEMFSGCTNLKTITGLDGLVTINVRSMNNMFENCTALETLDLSGFDFSNALDVTNMIKTATNLQEIKAPGNMNDMSTALPDGFYTDKIYPEMQGTTILRGSKELNQLVNTLRSLSTCLDYMKGPELKAIYDNLNATDKEIFATLKDGDDVLLLDKLLYMAHYAVVNPKPESATAGKNLVVSDIASRSPVLVILIGCISVAFIGGYYFAQKRKYAK